jgi:hypothetical protein
LLIGRLAIPVLLPMLDEFLDNHGVIEAPTIPPKPTSTNRVTTPTSQPLNPAAFVRLDGDTAGRSARATGALGFVSSFFVSGSEG